MTNLNQKNMAVILTALGLEFKAVEAHLEHVEEVEHPQGTLYKRGDFDGETSQWQVGIAEIGEGNAEAAIEIERAIHFFKPEVVFFVGVAGGIKDDLNLGDVVVASKVYGYEAGKAQESFLTRPEVERAPYGLEQRVRSIIRDEQWTRRIIGVKSELKPKAFLKPIAAGEKLVASSNAEVWSLIKSHYNDAYAVDMEDIGFLKAVRRNPGISALIVRGISDLVEGKAEADKGGWQPVAAAHASAFALEVLAKTHGRRGKKFKKTHQTLSQEMAGTKNSEVGPQDQFAENMVNDHTVAIDQNDGTQIEQVGKIEQPFDIPQIHGADKQGNSPNSSLPLFGQQSLIHRPFQVPPLPPHFVSRPEILEDLKCRLFIDEENAPGIIAIYALHGMGGIGKSILAMAFSGDPQVLTHFPHGVLWTTLGQKPDLLPLLSGWIQALGDYSFQPLSVQAASVHLRSLLNGKACLLVIDDVWEADHVKPFLAGSSTCRAIVTTRRVDIIEEVGAKLIPINVMTPEQSLTLLEKKAGWIPENERQDALTLANAVGYLPLALELAAARRMHGVSWLDLLGSLNAEVARLEKLEGPQAYKGHLRLEASFRLSLDVLWGINPDIWRAFAWLGILYEDVSIAAPAVARLWEISISEAAELLDLFWNEALLVPDWPINIQGRMWNAYRLHDLLYDFARKMLTSATPSGLGYSLVEAHRVFLRQVQHTCAQSGWHLLSDDAYIHSHLAWHMEQAQLPGDLHALLQETSASGKNGWFEVQERLGQTSRFLEDIQRAWRLAASQDNPTGFSLQCRYALVNTSLISQAKNLIPELICALTEKGLWSYDQTLAHLRQVSDISTIAETIVKLAKIIPEQWLSVMVDFVNQQLPGNYWAEAMENLAPRLSLDDLKNVFDRAILFQEEEHRQKAICALIGCIPEAWLEQALQVIKQFNSECYQNLALIELAPRLAAAGQPEEALSLALKIEWLDHRSMALCRLSKFLPENLLVAAFEAVQKIEWKWESDRSITLLSIATYIPLDKRRSFLETIGTVEEYAYAFSQLGDRLPIDLMGNVVALVYQIQEPDKRINALARLGLPLTETVCHRALQEVVNKETSFLYERAKMYARLLPFFPECTLDDALNVAYQIQEKENTEYSLQTWATCAAALGHICQALEVARKLSPDYQALTLSRIASWMPVESRMPILAEALDVALRIPEDSSFEETIADLAPQLTVDLLQKALDAVQKINDQDEFSFTLASLSNFLPYEQLQAALEAAGNIQNTALRDWAFQMLIVRLCELGHAEEALERIQQLSKTWIFGSPRTEFLHDVIRRLPQELLGSVLALADALPETWSDKCPRSEVQADIAQRMPEEDGKLLLKQVLRTIKQYPECLPTVAEYLPKDQRHRALLREINALIGPNIKKHLQEERLAELAICAANLDDPRLGLRAARIITDPLLSAWTYTEILPGLIPTDRIQALEEALASARQVKEVPNRAGILARLSVFLPEEEHNKLRSKIWTMVQEIQNLEDFAWAVCVVAPFLEGQQQEDLLKDGLMSKRDIMDKFDPSLAASWIAICMAQVGYVNLAVEAALSLPGYRESLRDRMRSRAFWAISTPMAKLPQADLTTLWQQILPALAIHPRRDLLDDLAALGPVLYQLGGEAGVSKTYQAILDVERWWP